LEVLFYPEFFFNCSRVILDGYEVRAAAIVGNPDLAVVASHREITTAGIVNSQFALEPKHHTNRSW